MNMDPKWKKFYVPWADVSEWNTVRKQMFSTDPNETIKAYWTILMWKLRFDSVPAYIECTFGLLQVMVKEYEIIKKANFSSSIFNEYDLQLSYSTALIRFVNHVCSISSYKGETLYLAAKTQNIPDWIINMRHDAAHGRNLPTLEALHLAAEIALKWLLDNYWMNKSNFVEKSLEITHSDLNATLDVEDSIKAQNFLKKAFDLWEYIHEPKVKERLLIEEIGQEFILHIEEMLSLSVSYYSDFESNETDFMKSLISEFSQQKKGNLNLRREIKFFKKSFLHFLKNTAKYSQFIKNMFVISLFETTFLSENHFEPLKWEPILHLIQEIGLFSCFIEILFQFAGEGHRGAATWLSVLLPSLKQLQKQWAVFKAFKKENKNSKRKLLKKKVLKYYGATGLIIKLGIFKPPTLNLEIMSELLLNPGNFDIKEIAQYLKLIKPPLLKSTIQVIKELLNLHSAKEKIEEDKSTNDKIFTVEDLKNFIEKENDLVFEQFRNDEKGWLKSSIDIHVWSKCSLGLLPFQSKVDCKLPNNITWKGKPSLQKKNITPLMKHNMNMKRVNEI